jgi:tetratricopeptide (TPR) repeat protein
MFRWLPVTLAMAVVAGAIAARAQTPDGVLAAADAFRERRFEVAIRLLTGVIESGEAKGEMLSDAYWNRGISYSAIGDRTRGFADFERFTTLVPASADGQAMLVEVGVELKRYPEAARAFARLLVLAPGRARDRRVDVLLLARAYQLQGEWQQASEVLEGYAEVDDGDAAINVSRARTAAALARREEAIDLVRRSAGQHNLVLVRADRTFAALWDDPAFASATDLAALYERDLAQAERGARDEPDRLFMIVLRMSALWRLGRFDEAVALGEQTLASDLSRFVDRDYREAQVHEQLARSLVMKGDLAAAERRFRIGVERLADRSETVVTLLMSAGQFLAATAGKYRDALEHADRADTLARMIYGSGIGDSVRALAYWGLGQQRNLDRILAQVEENLATSQSIAIDLYLLTGRRDDAARLVASQLADPARVDTMLVSLQRYTKNRPPAGAVEKIVEDGWQALRSHPVVLAAVAKVGRITDVPGANRF